MPISAMLADILNTLRDLLKTLRMSEDFTLSTDVIFSHIFYIHEIAVL